MNFWLRLKKPIFVLAPMLDVTDAAFRHSIAELGKPDVIFTEFVSADGLCSPGRPRLIRMLEYSEIERPIVAQIFGSRLDKIEEAARFIATLGFDGIDINMGCPVDKVINQNSCSALIRDPALAQAVVAAAKKSGLPVSVKTRIGFNEVEIERWIPQILEAEPAALTIYLRTVKERSKVAAHWELMKRIVEIRDEKKSSTLILGNGDVKSLAEARQKVEETGCDGVMIGRAAAK